ncbi:hypothetical protein CHS0354_000106 [Potamilus streckersoni]|uniref:COMM domain-containing protein n=1 Tax=Potamilus streckersoni TaxID=2493646 RepID=A0AAE0WEC7_9BIVA|nr:hypothetical protein CHS0354_000106 [Potamilus streckersoni]
MTVMAEQDGNVILLKKQSSKDCTSLLHGLVDGLCHRSHPTYQEYSKIWTLSEWWTLVDTFQVLIKSAVKESWTKDQILQRLDGLSDDYKTSVVDVISSRKEEIHSQLLAQTHSISQAVLSDFDWKLKLALSSDKISSLQEPLLTLKLDVLNDEQKETVSVELNREDLKKLISSLEGANKALLQLKS